MMKKSKCLVLCTSMLVLLAVTACKPPADTPSTTQDTMPADSDDGAFLESESEWGEPSDDSAPEEQDPQSNPQSNPQSTSQSTSQSEPDWDALKTELIAKHQKSFVPPQAGEKIILVLKNGTKKPGMLEKVEGDTVFMELEAGSIGYPRSALHPSSQVQLFAVAHGQYHAAQEWRDARTTYEKEKREREIAAAKASGAAMVPVNDPAKNGAVWQVVEYLRDYVRNPETIRFKKWGKVQQVEAGYRVSLQYEFSTETMKNAVTHKWFLMDKTGKVYRTALFKE
jgi:hypothetical protein